MKNLHKITFVLDSDEWHGSASESQWAEHVVGSQFRLRNSPFFVFGVSHKDIVLADKGADGKTLVFRRMWRASGHSTYRIFFTPDKRDAFDEFWPPLEDLGCTYEEGTVIAIDVPPEADIYLVYQLLEHGESCGAWGFEEGHCGHRLRD